MIVHVMALYDSKAQAYKTPFFVSHVAMGERAVADAVNNQRDSDLFKFPEDFTLWHLGTFNDDNGQFSAESVMSMGHLVQYKKGLTSVQSKVA